MRICAATPSRSQHLTRNHANPPRSTRRAPPGPRALSPRRGSRAGGRRGGRCAQLLHPTDAAALWLTPLGAGQRVGTPASRKIAVGHTVSKPHGWPAAADRGDPGAPHFAPRPAPPAPVSLHHAVRRARPRPHRTGAPHAPLPIAYLGDKSRRAKRRRVWTLFLLFFCGGNGLASFVCRPSILASQCRRGPMMAKSAAAPLALLVLLGVPPPSFVAHAGWGPGAPVRPAVQPPPPAAALLRAAAARCAPPLRLAGGAGGERTRDTATRARRKTQDMEVDVDHELEAAVKRRAQVCRALAHCGARPSAARAAASGVHCVGAGPSARLPARPKLKCRRMCCTGAPCRRRHRLGLPVAGSCAPKRRGGG